MRFYGRLYGLSRAVLERRIVHLMKTLELERFAKIPFDELSSGTKQKLAIAKAMINEPKIIFLDEPTVGLDVLLKGSGLIALYLGLGLILTRFAFHRARKKGIILRLSE